MNEDFIANSLFARFFDNWYAFHAGPVEYDIYRYWYDISKGVTNFDYIRDDKRKLTDFFKKKVAYEGRSENKYNLKMLYFCCLLDLFYNKFPSFEEEEYFSKNDSEKMDFLVEKTRNLLLNNFKKEYKDKNYEFTVNDLINLSHEFYLWLSRYSPSEFKKMEITEMDTDAMEFFIRVNAA